MSKYLTCEAEMDIPKPYYQIVADQVRALFDGHNFVATSTIARTLNCSRESLMFYLRKAERLGLIARAQNDSWLPTVSR